MIIETCFGNVYYPKNLSDKDIQDFQETFLKIKEDCDKINLEYEIEHER